MTTQIKAGVIAANAITATELASSALSGGSFTGDVTFDTNTLVVDSANNRVGVGTASPGVALDVSQANARIKVQDGTNQLNIGLWDGTNHRIEGDANRKLLITSYHTDGIHLGGSGNSHLVIKSGNVGIGVTPSSSTYKNLQINTTGIIGSNTGYVWFGNNWVYNSGDKYIANGYATLYGSNEGKHTWFIAPSGTAGNAISFSQVMTIDNSGNLLSGTSTSKGSRLQVASAGVSAPTLGSSTNTGLLITNSDVTYGMNFGTINNGNGWIQQHSNTGTATAYNLLLQPVGGNVGIGTSSPSQILHVKSASPNILLEGTNYPALKWAGTDLTTDAEIYYGIGGNDLNIINYNSGIIAFKTSNSERIRIQNDGDIRIGISNAAITGTECYTFSNRQEGNNLALYTQGNASFYSIDMWNLVGGTCNQVAFRSGGSGTVVGSITSTGNTATQYNTSSDYRLKENIQPLANGLERLQQLKPVQFDWKVSGETSEGFIAHEVQEVFPEAVSGEKDGEDMQGMDYGRITPLLVKAIQEQQTLIDALQARLDAAGL